MFAPVDFSQARFKHLNWKFRIRAFLDGKETLTTAQAVSHRDCDLGKWYYAKGKTVYGHLPEMQEFEREHEKLHALVRQIVDEKGRGNMKESERLYSELLLTSDNIIRLLEAAEKSINQKANNSLAKEFA